MAKQIKIFINLLTIISILSCSTTKSFEQDKDLETFVINEIEDKLSNCEYMDALQLNNFYKTKTLSNDRYLQYKNEIYKQLPLKLNSYYNNKEWDKYFTLKKSLERLGIIENVEISNNENLEFILNNTEESLYKSGVLLGEDILQYKDISNEELLKLYTLYNSVTVANDFPLLIKELLLRDLVDKNNIYEQDNNFIDGVITIFVNRGIKFEKGVGSQDIVLGSGFFIDKKGYALTNYHVIESCVDPEYEGITKLYIHLNNSVDKIPAKVIGWDPVMDIALIKVSTIPDYVFSFSDTSTLNVGDNVKPVGPPGGLGSTVTTGIVSATGRRLLETGEVIQIDSAINPGNSGGPLLDKYNKVTNIVFAGIEDFEGVNFAIPVLYVYKGLVDLYQGGEIKHSWFGAALIERKKNIEVIYVEPNSPAYYIGLEKGDIIKKINGKSFKNIIEIQNDFFNYKPSELIDISFSRNKDIFEKQVCLSERKDGVIKYLLKQDAEDNLYNPLFGMDIEFSGKLLWNKNYIINDIYPGTIADELELQKGDIITIKDWDFNEEYEVVVVQLTIQSKKEGFWEKSIQIMSPIYSNLFI